MYVPTLYRRDEDLCREVVTRYPLALLLTNGGQAPYATHVPVIPSPGAPLQGSLVGTDLLGHLNRANPHWSALRAGEHVRLAFVGPHAYVSPTLYRTTPAAPTWNYIAVHLSGVLDPLPGRQSALEVVRRTVAHLEASFGEGWDDEESVDYFRSIVGGVGAFRIHVLAVDGMFKLSQEKDEAVRQEVSRHLAGTEVGAARDLAAWMNAVSGPRADRTPTSS